MPRAKKQPTNIDIRDFQLLHDHVLIQEVKIEEKDGIVVPDSYEGKPELGRVISVGSGRIADNGSIVDLVVRRDDTVYFNRYTTTKYNFDGNDYYVVREEDIVGFLR